MFYSAALDVLSFLGARSRVSAGLQCCTTASSSLRGSEWACRFYEWVPLSYGLVYYRVSL